MGEHRAFAEPPAQTAPCVLLLRTCRDLCWLRHQPCINQSAEPKWSGMCLPQGAAGCRVDIRWREHHPLRNRSAGAGPLLMLGCGCCCSASSCCCGQPSQTIVSLACYPSTRPTWCYLPCLPPYPARTFCALQSALRGMTAAFLPTPARSVRALQPGHAAKRVELCAAGSQVHGMARVAGGRVVWSSPIPSGLAGWGSRGEQTVVVSSKQQSSEHPRVRVRRVCCRL